MSKQINIVVILASLLVVSLVNAQTDFFELVKNGTPREIQTAINKGAKVNAQTKEGYTPLMYAAASNPNPDVIFLLLNSGANVSMKNNAGATAFTYAQNNVYLNGTDAYRKLERISSIDMTRMSTIFHIEDDFCFDSRESCGSNISLSKVEGGYMVGGSCEYRNGKPLIWCDNAMHTWIGKSENVAERFKLIESDEKDPLRFEVNREFCYIYRGGKGVVILSTGKFYIFPQAGNLGSNYDINGVWEGRGTSKGTSYWIRFSVGINKTQIDSFTIGIRSKKRNDDAAVIWFPSILISRIDSFQFILGKDRVGTGMFTSDDEVFGTFTKPIEFSEGKTKLVLVGPWRAKKVMIFESRKIIAEIDQLHYIENSLIETSEKLINIQRVEYQTFRYVLYLKHQDERT